MQSRPATFSTPTTARRALFRESWLRSRFGVILACLSTLIGVAPVLVLSRAYNIPLPDLVRDPAAVSGAAVYIGFLSNIGLFGWAAACALWGLNAIVLWRERTYHPLMPFSIGSAGFTGLLLLDDAFLLHENILPNDLGIPEPIVLAAYGIIAIVYVCANMRPIFSTAFPLLLVSVGCLGASVAVDIVFTMSAVSTFVEDSLKFAGICFWMIYAGAVSIQVIDTLRQQRRNG